MPGEKEGDSFSFRFLISDPNTKDSHNTYLSRIWDLERYNANPVVLYNHHRNSNDPNDVVGRADLEETKRGLEATISLDPENPKANALARQIRKGLIGASVGFEPIGIGMFGSGDEARGKPNESYYYGGQRLFEISLVPIPSNSNTLRLNK